MKTAIKSILAVIVTIIIFMLTRSNNYDDCILKNMRGVNNDIAAAQIRRSCRARFPEKLERKKYGKKLSLAQIGNLTGRAGLSFGNYYSGNIYNGNDDITVTEIAILIKTTINGEEVGRIYKDEVGIPPRTTANFSFDIIVGDKDAVYSWSIVGAKGIVE